ncbi:MAG: hypothetical protein HY763_05950 [Planctomycetes bacterium]|nr:hypothetical protein [Planctomycetota bacterium]
MLKPTLFRRVYDAAALLAVLNVAALAAGVGFLAGSGRLGPEQLRQIAAVIRGELPTPPAPAQAAPPVPVPAAGTEEPGLSDLPPVGSQTDLEIMRREAARIQEELRQRMALNNSILLKVATAREEFKRERDAAKQQDKVAGEDRQAAGFEKQVEIYEGLAPRLAAQHLLGLSDPDEAARIMVAMDARKAKKIVESAKSGEEMQRMMGILQRVREVAPTRSAKLSERP